MVSTRSHDHTPATMGKERTQDSGFDVGNSGKRKRQHDVDAMTPTHPVAKRRKSTERGKNGVVSTPQYATAVVVEVKAPMSKENQVQEILSSIQSQDDVDVSALTSSRSPQFESSVSDSQTDEVPVGQLPAKSKENIDQKQSIQRDNEVSGQSPVSSKPRTKSKKSKKTKNLQDDNAVTEDHVPGASDEPKTNTTIPEPPKSTHKRFDSTEPEPELPQPQPQDEEKETEAPKDALSDNEDSTDDEAPETITASAGQAQALTTALEQSKAAAQLDKEKKRKRRERDARLKQQAEAAKKEHKIESKPKKSSNAEDPIADEAVNKDNTPTSNAKPQSSNKAKQPLPALLPDYILADEPSVRPLISHPSSTAKISRGQKKRFLDLEQKPPKDVRKGGVRMRVLQEGNSLLPPKANQQGRALREAWLMGRRGGSGVERRKMVGQGEFVRR